MTDEIATPGCLHLPHYVVRPLPGTAAAPVTKKCKQPYSLIHLPATGPINPIASQQWLETPTGHCKSSQAGKPAWLLLQ